MPMNNLTPMTAEERAAFYKKNEDFEQARERFLERIKHSVGYVESDNRTEFLKGVSVAFSWLTEDYEKALSQKDSQIKNANDQSDYYRKDLKALCEIIRRHSDIE